MRTAAMVRVKEEEVFAIRQRERKLMGILQKGTALSYAIPKRLPLRALAPGAIIRNVLLE